MSSEQAPEDRFWLTFLRLGFVVFAGEAVVIGAYLLSTPDGHHRALLTAISVIAAVAAGLNLLVCPWIAQRSWRLHFSVGWTLTSGVVLTACIALDGGLGSPMLALLLLPLMFGSLIFGPSAVGLCGLASLAELAVLGIADGGNDEARGTFLLAVGATAGVSLVVWLTSLHRSRLQAQAEQLTRDLEVLATTDDLTGCLNHRAFFARLNDEIARATRYGQTLSLVVADIDDFKSTNDTFGHGAGDVALRRAGEILRAGSRESDIVARIGGDEFALLLPSTGIDDAVEQAMRLFGRSGADERHTSFSAGVAMLNADEPTADRLFLDVDTAMYHVKHTGRAGVAMVSPLGGVVRMDGDRVRRTV